LTPEFENSAEVREKERCKWVLTEAFEGSHDLDKFAIDAWLVLDVAYEGRGVGQSQGAVWAGRSTVWNRSDYDRLKWRVGPSLGHT
jgi:hypothetical protein